jgi:hypothetical protein
MTIAVARRSVASPKANRALLVNEFSPRIELDEVAVKSEDTLAAELL